MDPSSAGGASEFENLFFGGVRDAASESSNYLAEVAGDGLVGGLRSIAQDGSFVSGFLAAGFSSAAGQGLQDLGTNAAGIPYDNVVTSAVSGGIGSVLGGGKFANGAETGAFGYLFNRCAAGGCFTRISASISATLAYFVGDSVSVTVGVNFPNNWSLDELQLFGGVSENPMIGVGAYAGIGASAGISYDASLLPVGRCNGVNLIRGGRYRCRAWWWSIGNRKISICPVAWL